MTEEDLLKLKKEAARLENLLNEIVSYERVICNFKSHPELLENYNRAYWLYTLGRPTKGDIRKDHTASGDTSRKA